MRRALLVCALACVQCGPKTRMVSRDAPVPWETSGIDWTKPPPLAPPVPFAPVRPQMFALANGLRVVVVANPRLPLVAISFVHAAAGSRGDGDKPGLAALTAELLDKGAGERSSASLREALELVGARLTIGIATDHATMRVAGMSGHLAATLDLLADVTQRPSFRDFEHVRAQRVAEVDERRQRLRTIAAQTFDRVTFGGHPYALPADGDPMVVAALTLADVRDFWSRAYRPDEATLIVVGGVRAAQVRQVAERAFGRWAAATTSAPASTAPKLDRHAAQLVLVDVPGSRQSAVVIGTRAAAAGDPRQLAEELASSIVGGGTGGRLDHELHDKLGLTLGASASYWRGRWAGSWTLAATFSRDKTLDGIRAALRVVETARDISADELARAKLDLRTAAQLSFDTVASTARAYERLVASGLPLDWYATYAEKLDATTLADVRAAATWQDLSIVVAGDRAQLELGLGQLGLPVVHYPAGPKP